MTLQDRFWSRVEKTEGCWRWTAGTMHGGYGAISVDGRTVRAHRVSWELHFGPIPEGMWVLHHCDNPPCVRPEHLFLGNNTINTADRDRKGRHARLSGERHSQARLTWAQVRAIRASTDSERVTARAYGVGSSTVHRIRHGINWRDNAYAAATTDEEGAP